MQGLAALEQNCRKVRAGIVQPGFANEPESAEPVLFGKSRKQIADRNGKLRFLFAGHSRGCCRVDCYRVGLRKNSIAHAISLAAF